MYDKSIFAKVFGASLGVLLLVAAIGVYGGLAYAVPVSGVGGFTITADSIDGEGATVYPTTGETSEQSERAMYVVELQKTTIEGLEIRKPVNIPGAGEKVVVISSSGTVTSDELLLKTSSVSSGDAMLTGLELDETPSSGESFEVRTGEVEEGASGNTVSFNGSEPGLQIRDNTLRSHYLVTNQIRIPGLSVTIENPSGNTSG